MRWINKYRKDQGFSLLEILVAFAILSLSIGVLLRIFAGGGNISKTADDYYRAVITAEALLTGLGVETPLQPGVMQGTTETGFRWTATVMPYPINPKLLGAQTGAPMMSNSMGFLPFWVEIAVEWGPEEDPRAFTLESLRLVMDRSQGGF
jgi:general secretion pathway protein I